MYCVAYTLVYCFVYILLLNINTADILQYILHTFFTYIYNANGLLVPWISLMTDIIISINDKGLILKTANTIS